MPLSSRQRLQTFLLIFCLGFAARGVSATSSPDPPAVVGYMTPHSTAEHRAAQHWLRQNVHFQPRQIDPSDAPQALSELDVLWLHLPDSTSYARWKQHSGVSQALRSFYEEGGALLLTNYAALLPADLGLESAAPEKRVLTIAEDEHNDKKGYQSFRGHPVFTRGLLGGGPVWDAPEDHRASRIGYFGDQFPEDGKVAAVERARTAVRTENKLLIEYDEGPGHVLAAGAYTYLSRPNNLDVKLKRFLENALLYLSGRLRAAEESGSLPNADRKTYWPHMENVPRRFVTESDLLASSAERTLTDRPRTELRLTRSDPEDQFWDLAGRRALLMGYENGGIDEVWTHPFKLLFDYEVGLVTGDSLTWLRDLPLRVEVRPESFTRIYDTPKGSLKEIIYPSLQGAGGMVHYEVDRDARLLVRFRSDLKYMWPYPKSALGNVYYAYDESLNALHVRDKTSDFYCLMGGDLPARQTISGQYGAITWRDGAFETTSTAKNQVYHAVLFELDEQNDHTLNYAFAGTNEGKQVALRDYRDMLERPQATYAEVVEHYRRLLNERVTLDTPNDTLDRLFKWALVGTDRFFIRTPHLGEGLTAGYATSDPDGGTWASGTPGYAWYFGRDGEWSGFAVDDYGDFDLVKRQLELLQRFQDLRGKIFHALNTAGPGVQQFNAADSTPLYIILAAHYLRASGDLGFIRESWPHLKQAMDFLYSTDTDGDGLIENTNVGHGWVEFGELGDAHTTFYLAGLWAQALEDASYLAAKLGKEALSQRYDRDAGAVQSTLNTDFWNAEEDFFYQAKTREGGYTEARTMLPAVPMLFGELDAEKTRPVLRSYASNAFSSDWGMRIVDQYSDLYNPESYHLGTVWPLFTGWTALAEYEYGRSTTGFRHVANNLYIKNDWALGYIEEVLHGDNYEPEGFCHHQCWSETNVLHPTITGMIGWAPDAPTHTATLTPRFPLHWSEVTARNLRVGSSTIRLRMERGPHETRYRLTLTDGAPVDVRLAPELPAGQRIEQATVNGRTVSASPNHRHGLLAEPIRLTLTDQTTVRLQHTGGVGMAPVVPHPEPGDDSQGYRIVNTDLDGATYRIALEGRADTEHTFRLNVFDQHIEAVDGAEVKRVSDAGLARLTVPFGTAERGPFAHKTVTVRLTESTTNP